MARYLTITLEALGVASRARLLDEEALAVFYDRNNLLLNGDVGWVPGNVFATIEEGLAAMAEACTQLWRHGFAGERLTFTRA